MEPERWFFTVAAGLAMGSFASVLQHRMPRGASLLHPRSYCPHCEHALAPGDMVPLLSYLWLRGRCRYCTAPISMRYPLLEACTAGVAVAAGAAGGMAASIAAVLVWCAVIALYSRRLLKDERGATLVELLATAAILALVLAPMTEAILALRSGPKAAHYRGVATNIARSKAEELHAKHLRASPSNPFPLAGTSGLQDHPYDMVGYRVEWWFENAEDEFGSSADYTRKLIIKVSCSDCPQLYSYTLQPYWLITAIRRVN